MTAHKRICYACPSVDAFLRSPVVDVVGPPTSGTTVALTCSRWCCFSALTRLWFWHEGFKGNKCNGEGIVQRRHSLQFGDACHTTSQTSVRDETGKTSETKNVTDDCDTSTASWLQEANAVYKLYNSLLAMELHYSYHAAVSSSAFFVTYLLTV